MKTFRTSLAVITLLSMAGTADAQLFVQGFLHSTFGDAMITLDTEKPKKRKIRHIGLSSSGQDGIAVRMMSGSGGAVVILHEPILEVAGAVLQVDNVGIDGVVRGSSSMLSHGDGSATVLFDFSGVGATGLTVVEYDENGHVVANDWHGGPFVGKDVLPNFTCPNGEPASISVGHYWSYTLHKWISYWMWSCAGGGDYTGSQVHRVIIVTPDVPVGSNDEVDTESLRITGSNLPDFDLIETDIGTFGARSSGVGSAILMEQCQAGLPTCLPQDRVLGITNLGTDGHDGVEIDVNPGNQHTSFKLVKGGWNLKECTKFQDDEGNEMLRVCRDEVLPGGGQELEIDMSGIGVSEYVITFNDPNGVPLASQLYGGGNPAGPVLSGNCGSLFPEVWEWDPITKSWLFKGCDVGSWNVRLAPGLPEFGPVGSMSIAPIGMGEHRLARLTLTCSSDVGSLVVAAVDQTPFCPSDFDGSGFVDLEDYAAFVLAFEEGTSDADFDGSGFVDLEDFSSFVHAFEEGC
ncbi:MAG: EF-hand domain-containing protein [Phycisphaeraceae bacterium]|nr:EF-hand domain-containing protein [Phycisphaerae bacterium]MBX3392176.1 EF-hand domain-containing protein [Phycisphaeraceae bacterium]HRJ50178.1 EF-hand domain-containing protein [Phycisphaerales bacterium]